MKLLKHSIKARILWVLASCAALLVSTLLLAAPMLALMLHCIYHTFYSRHASWGMSHGFPTPLEDAHLPSPFLYVAS